MNKNDLISEDMYYASTWTCIKCKTNNSDTYYCKKCGYYNNELEDEDYLYKIAHEDD